MQLSEVSNILWRERQLLELLLFKLEEEQLILASGRTRWLTHATREVETVLGEIKRVELERAVELESVAQQLGFRKTPTLKELSELTTGPWGRIFSDHRNALLALAQEIDGLTESNREMLARGQRAVHEALQALGELSPETYSTTGIHTERQGSLGLINEVI